MRKNITTRGKYYCLLFLFCISSCAIPIDDLCMRILDIVDSQENIEEEVRPYCTLPGYGKRRAVLYNVLKDNVLYEAVLVSGEDTLRLCRRFWGKREISKDSVLFSNVEKGCLLMDSLSKIDKSFFPLFMNRSDKGEYIVVGHWKNIMKNKGIAIAIPYHTDSLIKNGYERYEDRVVRVSYISYTPRLRQTLARYDSIHYNNLYREAARLSEYKQIEIDPVYYRTWQWRYYYNTNRDRLIYDSNELTPLLYDQYKERIYR